MNTTTGTKAAALKIEKIIAKLKRSHYLLSFAAEQSKNDDNVWELDFTVRDEHETIVVRSYRATAPIADIVSDLEDEIKTVRAAHAAAEEAAREAALNRPATPEEKRAFDRLVEGIDYAAKRYARAADKMRTQIDNDEDIYTSTHDELLKAQGELTVMRRLRYELLRNCSIVKTLTVVEELCDRETSFYVPSRSSSPSSNIVEDTKHAHLLKMGRIARLRAEY